MSKVFVVDINRCNGCHNCQVVCKDEHCSQPWLPYTEEQPETGHFWMRVNEKTRGQVPAVRVSYRPTMCNHCADAPCVKACAQDAFKRRSDGLLLIDPEKCNGCMECAKVCPLDAIFENAYKSVAQKCTGCAHLLDNGWAEPRCVDACCTGALRFGEEKDFDLSEAVCLDKLSGYGPKVYYLNYPKRFVAGCVVDVASDEVVIGAQVDLLDQQGVVVASLATDDFGDFKFDQIEAGSYDVVISGKDFGRTTVQADVREIDLSLGIIDISAS